MATGKKLFDDVPEPRRRIMRSIKAKETKPEKFVRSLLQKNGFRFRKNVCTLSGKPDVVFPGRKKVIFVHGCFWHSHDCMPKREAKVRSEFWATKFARNIERDRGNINALESGGWDTLVIWECELKDTDAVLKKIISFLNTGSK